MHVKTFITLALASFATAGPIEKRQTGSTSKEFSRGGCRDVLFAWARGSTELGNMGSIAGPGTSDGLKRRFGAQKVATEGIDYAASLAPNAVPGGTDAQSKTLMRNMLNSMASKCPNSVIVAGGYSQGAAVCHRAIEGLPAATKARIAGVVLYGDTQKQQDRNQIPGFDKAKTKIICAAGDLVCTGSLVITPAHLTYGANTAEGAAFLAQRIVAAQGAAKGGQAKREAEEQGKRAVETVGETLEKMAVKIMA